MKIAKGIDFKNLINNFANIQSKRKKILVFNNGFQTFLNLYFSAEIRVILSINIKIYKQV